MREKRNPCTPLVEMQTGVATMERVWRFYKKLKIQLPYDPANPLLSVYPEKMKTLFQKDTHTQCSQQHFTIAKTWKKPKCLSTVEWIKKMWYICIQWNITKPQKKNELIPSAPTWIDLEIVILSEVSQTEKDKYYISLICLILKK